MCAYHDHNAHTHHHTHEHTHEHEERCSCGYEHEHHHGEACSCGEHHDDHDHVYLQEDKDAYGEVRVERRLHDEARVISGSLLLFTEYESLRAVLKDQLEALAQNIQKLDGIVGHIKASADASVVEMFSVTDTDVSIKKAPGQRIKINLAAIVFLIEPEKAEELVTNALNAIKNAVA
jgi:hypothetical protein